jgi:hypothetical protein
MADAVIENPILNTPFAEPARHCRFGDTGITDEKAFLLANDTAIKGETITRQIERGR